MAQLDAKSSGRMGFRALTYYTATTVLAAVVGIVMVLIIHPGDPRIKSTITAARPDEAKVSTLDAILDIIRYRRDAEGTVHDAPVTSVVF